MIRVILDANIYISAFLKPAGLQSRLLEMALDEKYQIVLSREIFDEICTVLQRRKISERLPMSLEEVKKNLKRLVVSALWTDSTISVKACEDPDDDIYLACAKESQADYLISGDQHLLKLKEYDATKIVTSKWFLDYSHSSARRP
ncbi:MAG: putative toxin-antitoxin system toxin component, PIN family [Deltaproteobacteria bacterium]|nr:putative toxin-antitoxin system toxin component, PIN family [Deltaproteobacteria bacterium]